MIRRLLQVVLILLTLVVGATALVVIVSETIWFKDWLRGYIVRQADQYLRGNLEISRLGGDLFFGVELEGIQVKQDGQPVIAIKDVGLDYSFLNFLTGAFIFDNVRLNEPVIHLRRTDKGWNLANLVERKAKEGAFTGPNRPIHVGQVGITDGTLVVERPVGTSGIRIPEQIDKLNARIEYTYQPVRSLIDVGHISFRTTSPSIQLNDTSGEILIESGRYEFHKVALRTAESELSVNGTIDRTREKPHVEMKVSSGKLALAEIGRIVPALQGMNLQPAFDISAAGPPNALGVKFSLKSTAGDVNGDVTVDSTAPDRKMTGLVHLGHLNLAPLLKSDIHRSDITGTARVNLRFEGSGPLGPVKGRIDLDASQARYAQYATSKLHATTWIEPARIRVEAHGQSYGGPIAAIGSIEPERGGRPLRFDLQGDLRHVNMQGLPRHLGVPAVASDVTGAYHVAGTAQRFSVRGTLDRSVVAGAVFSPGTVVSLTRNGRSLQYTAEGHTSGLNLRRFGRSFGISALIGELYESNIAGDFKVAGTGTALDTLAIDATGTLVDSELMGATIPRLSFDSHLHDRDLQARAQGQFSGFNPAVLRTPNQAGNTRIPDGDLSGTLDVNLGVRDITEPNVRLKADSTLDRLSLDGHVALTKSRVEQLDIDQATVSGTYQDGVAQLRTFDLKSPSVQATASGTVALDQTSQSDLRYSVNTQDASPLASMAKLPIGGAIQASGRVTGNASNLATTGQLKGSDVRYGEYRAVTLDSRYDVKVPDLATDRIEVKADSRASMVSIGGHTISDVKAATTYAGKTLDFDAAIVDSGRDVQSKGSLTLHPDHREVVLHAFSVATGPSRWALASDHSTTIRYGPARIEVDRLTLVAPEGDQRLFVDGGLGAGRLGLKIEAANVDLAPIDAMLLLDKHLQGRLTASAIVTGTTEQPLVQGQFSLLKGGIGGYTFESASADLKKEADVILVDGRLDQMPGAGLTVQGQVPLALFKKEALAAPVGEHVAGGPQMDLHLQSPRVDLAVLQAFTTRVTNTTGAANLDVTVRGTLHDPHLVGFLEMTDAGFTVVPTAVAYHGAQLRLNFEPDVVRIARFDLIDPHKHWLRLSGELAVHERTLGDVNLQVESQDFKIVNNDLADIRVDTVMVIGGDLRHPRLRGQVELAAGRVNVDDVRRMVRRPEAWQAPPDPFDFSMVPEAVSASRPLAMPTAKPDTSPGQVVVGTFRPSQPEEAARPEHAEPPPLTTAALFKSVEADIRFTMPNNLVLRGTELQDDESSLIGFGEITAMVGGDLSIRKAAGEGPRILGSVDTVRGTYSFQGRRFEILRGGVIRFVGLEELDPVLNITAERTISGVVAQVHIGGTLRSPELTLSSQPPLDQTDILSLIAFNQPANELGAGQSVSLAEQAASLGYGFAAGRLTRELGRALALDILDIQPPSDVEGGASVTVGNQVGRSTFLRVTQRFGPASSTEVGIEHQLTDVLRLDAKGAQGLAATRQIFRRVERAGVDLVFFFSY